jgi:hypothetical protein
MLTCRSVLAAASVPISASGARRPSLTVGEVSVRAVLGRVGTEEEWNGGKPLAGTFLRRLHRATARSVLEADLPPLSPPVARDVEVWVGNQLEAMPAHVRFGLAVVAVFVTLDAIVRTGRPQWRIGAQQRHLLLTRWAASPLVPVAQYIRLHRSLVLYAAHEHPEGLGYPR